MNPRNFFAELRRRNVYRVAVAYSVVSWLLIQIATQIFPFFEIPNWCARLVIVLLALGFPMAMILAWAYELTPKGIRRMDDGWVASPSKSVAVATTPEPTVQKVDAMRLWEEKLDYVQAQKAIAPDAAQRFALEKEIQEARATIARLQRSEHPSTREAPTIPIDISQIDKHAPANLIGREGEISTISSAWDEAIVDKAGRPYVLTITGMGGQGKSSLVAKWASLQAQQGWPGCDAVLAWSFYTQGTREVAAGSADLFLRYALAFFGDPTLAAGSAETKGRRLAELIGQRRALLILDGLEPLQYPPTSPRAGQLRDAGVAALVKGLASHNPGLCVVTTRISIQDLSGVRAADVRPLARLSTEAGVVLLRSLGVVGSAELMADLVDDVQGHALTLTLLGSFLKRAHRGDIERRDRIKWQKADSTEQNGHAFRAMEAYENWFLQGGEEGAREVAILRLMGLFDRPAEAASIETLCSEIIPGLNEPLVKLDEDDWSSSLTTLENSHLLTVNRDDSGQLISIDAHPLLREYFAAKITSSTRDLAQDLLLRGSGGPEPTPDNGPREAPIEPPPDHPARQRGMEVAAPAETARNLVFISYSNTDKQWRDIIHSVLESDPEIRDLLWDDTAIPPSKELAQEITDHLARAKVIIMITSPAYWRPNSGAVSFEVTPALKAHARQELDILWIPVKGYHFETSPVGHIMAATGPGAIPLENLRGEERESALLRLLAAVRRCLHLPVATSSTQERRGMSQESVEPLKSGLSLSGGGFRATFFHLGILAFHFRQGSLKDLKIITAVSGGAILAAHAVLHWETLIRDEKGFREVMAKLVTLARSNVRNRILVRWLWCSGTLWRFVGRAATRLSKSRTGRLVREYRTFYGRRALNDLDRTGRPWLALVATDLSNSSRVYFSQDGMRRLSIANNTREEPFPQKVELDVAFAVAASSSFPPIFRPLVLDYKVLRVRWDEFKLEMRLQDGGVHDNLGLRALQLITSAVDIVLGVIHASYVVNPDHIHKPGSGLFSDLRRALQIFTRGESAEIANDIATLAGAKAVITRLSDRVLAEQPHLLETDTQTCLMGFRTDLDSPNWSEMYALMAHGYQVAAMRSQHLDAGDLAAARALFCGILADGLARENGSTLRQEMPSINKIVSELSAEQLQRCGMRPKRRIVFHLLLYFSLLSALLFCGCNYGKPIAAWIQHFLPPVASGPLRIVVAGHADGINQDITEEIVKAVLDEKATVLLWTGNLTKEINNVSGGKSVMLELQLLAWRNMVRPLYDHGIKVLPVRGNRELVWYDPNDPTHTARSIPDAKKTWDKVFSGLYALPPNGPLDEKNVSFYYTTGSVLCVGLDQYQDGDVPARHAINQAWFDQVLNDHKKPFVFAYGHESAFMAGNRRDVLGTSPARSDTRDAMWESLIRAGARVYFCGHERFYDHMVVKRDGSEPGPEMHQLTAGSAGAPFANGTGYQPDPGWKLTRAKHIEQVYGYVLVTIEGNRATVSFKGRISPGRYEVMDSFSYVAGVQ